MNPVGTVAVMVGIFIIIGCIMPVFSLAKGKGSNRMLLWLMMAFAVVLIFGVTVDFSHLDNSIREMIVKYGFIMTGAFGIFFGIDMLLNSKYITQIQWRDLNIRTKNSPDEEEERK